MMVLSCLVSTWPKCGHLLKLRPPHTDFKARWLENRHPEQQPPPLCSDRTCWYVDELGAFWGLDFWMIFGRKLNGRLASKCDTNIVDATRSYPRNAPYTEWAHHASNPSWGLFFFFFVLIILSVGAVSWLMGWWVALLSCPWRVNSGSWTGIQCQAGRAGQPWINRSQRAVLSNGGGYHWRIRLCLKDYLGSSQLIKRPWISMDDHGLSMQGWHLPISFLVI